MPRHSEGPWFREAKNTWYVKLNGKQISLGVRGEGNQPEAVRAWHRLMAGLEPTPEPKAKPRPEPTPEPKSEALTVRGMVDAFLQDAEGRISPEAWRGYGKFLTPFAQAHGDCPAEAVTAQEAEAFARKPRKPAWSATYQAGFLGTLGTAYRWAVRERLIASNPVATVRKPAKASRGTKAVITQAEHEKLLAVADAVFADFLTMLWHTGARPGEVAGLTAEQVLASADGVIPLERHKEAHKGKARFLILSGEALAVARRRAEAVGTGLLFGGRLTPKAVCSKMDRLCGKAGVRRLLAYGYRHSFATQALAQGVPDAQVAALLGHSSTAMLHRHYSHLTAQAQVLRDALGKVRG